MARGKIQFNIQTLWQILAQNAVGPTADAAFRNNVDLPRPQSRSSAGNNIIDQNDDSLTLYVDPANGNDANTGTDLSADAVQTLQRAINLLGARTVIHVERTDALTHSDLTITSAPFNESWTALQIAAGQTASVGGTLTFAGGGIASSGDISFSGLAFTDNVNFRNGNGAGALTITCEWTAFTQTNSASLIDLNNEFGSASLTAMSRNSKLNWSGAPTGAEIEFVNDSFVGANAATIDLTFQETAVAGAGLLTMAYESAIASDDTFTLRIDRSTLVGLPEIIADDVDIDDAILHDIGTLRRDDGADLEIDDTLYNVGNVATPVTGTDNLTDADPLFLDQPIGDLRLAHVGREAAPGVNFPFTSPAVGAATGGRDMGAYDFTYTNLGQSADEFQFPGGTAWDPVDWEPTRANYQSYADILAGFHAVWDGIQHLVRFRYAGDSKRNDLAYEMARILRSETILRWFPYGDDGFFGAGGLAATPSGADVQISGLPVPLVPAAFIGWGVRLDWTDGGPRIGWFRIADHNADTLTLEWVRGDGESGFDGGSGHAVNIVYLPCRLDQNSLKISSDLYKEDDASERIKAWYNPAPNVSVEPGSPADWNFREFALRSTREEGDE